MTKFSRFLLFFVALCLSSTLQAQRSCASHDNHQQMLLGNPEMQKNVENIERHTQNFINSSKVGQRAVVTIPIVFHIVWRTGTPAENISDAQIMSQLDVINKDFRKTNTDISKVPATFSGVAADSEVEFCLAKRTPTGATTTGIVRYQSSRTTNWGTSDAVKLPASGGYAPWDATKYLNVWVCAIGSNILGYAQFPGGSTATDGVVIDYRYFGTTGTATTPFNLGRTATHEIGHWLNLRHIWGDANCGSDLVIDTPTHTTSNGGCPAFPKTNTCGGTTNTEMTMNYMDYTDDNCMYMFSAGQKARMQAVLAAGGARASLVTSNGCQAPTTTTCDAPTNLATASITTTGATVSWAAATGATSYNLQYKTSAATTWTTVAVTGVSRALTGLTAGTAYNFQVQTVCSATSSSAYSTAANFTTTAAAACNAPTNLAAASITTTGATVSWTAAVGATSYSLQYKTSAATTWTTVAVTGVSRALTGLTAGTTYNFQVRTVCSATSSSAYSTAANFTTTAAAACNAPTNLAAASITATGATVSWAAAAGATSYSLQYKTSAATTWTTVSSITTTSRTLTGLTAGTTYNFQVRTVCGASLSSAYATAVNFTTTAACVDNYENNNTRNQAKSISANGSITALISSSTDADWFAITTTAAAPKVRATLTNLPADYDLQLYSSSGTLLNSSLLTGNASETVKYNTGTQAATYYIKVYSALKRSNTTTCYTLTTATSATNFRQGEIDNDEIAEINFNLYPNPARDEVLLNFSTENSYRAAVTINDMMGRTISTQEVAISADDNKILLDVSNLENGFYFVTTHTKETRKTVKLMINR